MFDRTKVFFFIYGKLIFSIKNEFSFKNQQINFLAESIKKENDRTTNYIKKERKENINIFKLLRDKNRL